MAASDASDTERDEEVEESHAGYQEEEEEEEEEPLLLFQRVVHSDLTALLQTESISCIALCNGVLAVGMRSGTTVLLELSGRLLRKSSRHRGVVNDIGFDSTGAYVGTASEDGRVVIESLNGDESVVCDYHSPVKCLSLDPGYATSSRPGKKSRQFVCGGTAGKLLLNSKGWMGSKDHTLHQGEGCISTVRWCGSLIAWANELGVKLYDTSAHARIAFLERPPDAPRADAFPPQLAWEDEQTLIIGWADCVMVARISVTQPMRSSSRVFDSSDESARDAPQPSSLAVELATTFQARECFVSGLAPLGPSQILLLAYCAEEGEAGVASAPEVRCVGWDGEELTADALALKDHERAAPADLMLAVHAVAGSSPPQPLGGAASGPAFWSEGEAPTFCVASPRDVVVARPRDVISHVDWLVSAGRFERALDACDAAEACGLGGARGAARTAGDAWLGTLLARREFGAAAALCPRLLRADGEAWEQAAALFGAAGGLPQLAPHLPLAPGRLLDQSLYEMVLAACVASSEAEDHAALLAAVRSWPARLYGPPGLASALRGRIAALLQDMDAGLAAGAEAGGDPARLLKEALAEVLLADGQLMAGLWLLLELGSPNALPLIEHHRLLGAVCDRVAQLAALPADSVVPLLVEERAQLPPGSVVNQLRASRDPRAARLLQRYLLELHEAEPGAGAPWAGLAVELTAQLAPAQLMGLLATSTAYPLENAFAAAQAAGLVREQVFVLGRMGDARRALGLILDAMGDVDGALEFVTSQADGRLWDELILRAGSSPQLAGALLERIGGAVDARPLIAALPRGAQVERLRERLVKLLGDVRAQEALWRGCTACLNADVVQGVRQLHARSCRALRPQEVRWAD